MTVRNVHTHEYEPVKSDVKHGMSGEGECIQGKREGGTLEVVVHGYCCQRVPAGFCLCCRAGRSTLILKTRSTLVNNADA